MKPRAFAPNPQLLGFLPRKSENNQETTQMAGCLYEIHIHSQQTHSNKIMTYCHAQRKKFMWKTALQGL